LFGEIGREGVAVSGMPFARYRGMPTDSVDVEAGVPIAETATDRDDIVAGTLPATEAVEAVHVGPYDTLEQTYNEMVAWMSEHNLVPSDEMWEFYLTDPADEPDPQKWETKVVWPVVPVTV
jgi:AraC family transcriptional regulator